MLKNKSRIAHKHKIEHRVFLLKNILLVKKDPDREGTYDIVDIHANDVVDVRRDAIIQPINVRRLIPHF